MTIEDGYEVRKGILGREELALSPKLKLFTLENEEKQVANLDPITYEVLRHRLVQINEEQGITICRVSGSPVASVAGDFNVVIADEIGNVACVGTYVQWHGVIIDMLIKAVLETRSDNVGVRDGDIFITNDPFLGAGHQNDVAVLSPIFWEGRLFCWSGSMLHQLDVGGNAVGSFCIDAKTNFDEPVPVPPLKICENGEIRKDTEEYFLRHSRFPQLVGLDLRAQIAANHVAKTRIVGLLEKHGPETIMAVMKRIIRDSEVLFRKRLKELQDGTYRHIEYIEKCQMGDNKIHKAQMALIKKDDSLTFDLTGTDPQVGIVNCTYGGFRAGVMFPVMQFLCYDIPWASSGMFKAIQFKTKKGLMLDSIPPARVSCAGACGIYASMNLAQQCVAKMLAASPLHEKECVAMNLASWTLMMMSGTTQYGTPLLGFLMDPMAGCVGARSFKDGVDTGGVIHSPKSQLVDVEINELFYPMLYLYRREEADTGGGGKFRGGTGLGIAYIPHDTPDALTEQTLANGVTFPGNVGLSGGLPGGAIEYRMKRNSNIKRLFENGIMPLDSSEIDGEEEYVDYKSITTQNSQDVLFVVCGGSGGYGDPLERAPERVAKDVINGYVSLSVASEVYGVILDEKTLEINQKATGKKRKSIVDDRFRESHKPLK